MYHKKLLKWKIKQRMYHIGQQFNLLFILEREKYYIKVIQFVWVFFKISIPK